LRGVRVKDGRVKGGVCEKGGVGFDGRNANEGGAAARVARREGRQIHRSSFKRATAAETREILDWGFVLPKNVGRLRMRVQSLKNVRNALFGVRDLRHRIS